MNEGPTTERDADALDRRIETLVQGDCRDCRKALCRHEALLSLVLGFSDRPLCLVCSSRVLSRESREFRDAALLHVRRRDCFHEVWLRAGEREGFGRVDRPACLFGDEEEATTTPVVASTPPADPAAPTADYDAGDAGCGDLVLELRMRLRALAPGTVLRLRALDAGAPADIPAWCGLTGHALLRAEHPLYWIRRKDD